MRFTKQSILTLLALPLVSVASAQDPMGTPPPMDPAAAPEAGWPVAFTQRGITNPAGTLRIDADVGLGRASLNVAGVHVSATALGIDLGAAFAILDDLEVGAVLVPLSIPVDPSGDIEFGDLNVNATYRFLDGSFEAAARLDLNIPTSTDFGVGLGVPIALHFDPMRIDSGVHVIMTFADPDMVVGLAVPLRLNVNLSDNIFAGLATGFVIDDFSAAGDTIGIPLGVQLGYTLPGSNGPMMDLAVGFAFPFFYSSGAGEITTDLWAVTLGADIYLDLM